MIGVQNVVDAAVILRCYNMSQQPLYGTCWDNLVGSGHTSSRRGIVRSVGMDCNTSYGKCIKVNVGYSDGTNIVNKPDLRKFKKDIREIERQKYLESVDKETTIRVDISTAKDKHFEYVLDGVRINAKVIKLLKNGSEDFLAVVDRLLKSAEDNGGK